MIKKLTIGICAPSSPAHLWFTEKYKHALKRLEILGFNYVKGDLVKNKNNQGYRTAPPLERANEIMNLIENEKVDIIMPVIGGYNSGSLLPYLDFNKIEKSKVIFCGYSDITALHLGILSKTNLPTIYGASLIPTFGEYFAPLKESEESFLNCLDKNSFNLECPAKWSNQLLNAFTDEWKNERTFFKNDGWKIINEGKIEGEVLAFNINTLMTLLGSKFIPDLKNKILILEDMDATVNETERNLNALKLSGIFDDVLGLIFSKPEIYNEKNSKFLYQDLIIEIVGKRNYPIIYNFDAGHTLPSLCIPQKSILILNAFSDKVEIKIISNPIYNILSSKS